MNLMTKALLESVEQEVENLLFLRHPLFCAKIQKGKRKRKAEICMYVLGIPGVQIFPLSAFFPFDFRYKPGV